MKPTIQDLHESGHYRLVDSFRIDEMMQFLARELGITPSGQNVPTTKTTNQKVKAGLRLAIIFIGSLTFGWFVGTGMSTWLSKDELVSGGSQFLIGFLVFFPLITVHEFIHGIFFKRVGAPRVGYGWSWKGMMAYAYAQNYVMNLREVAFVAAMPFLILTPTLIVVWVLLPAYGVVWGTLLFLHTTGCIGDFVLINFWRKNQHRSMFTYDDVENESRTYFFECIS
ncbi:DUF3267 domain-containing protein [Fibrella forsythiae]|uniref:DUF3267 domain-containing protein n=1 Tax=Fibrella forsythiae TaxID=2817061 RepID=A0ABS3JM70_9BACT|nr:DUF3267 domain-containing protein [Fibrella forsythiae]MBO0951102.1 DUF3267 domain-containing protein [Fibrella forsythiae]